MPAVAHTTIRDKIVEIMQSVEGMGVVHDHEVYAANLSTLKEMYVSGGKLHGWHVRRVRFKNKQPHLGRRIVVTTWQLTGFLALDEATTSELLFDTEIDRIVEKFKAKDSLDQVVSSTWQTDQDDIQGFQLDNQEPVMFCGVLCHRARGTLITKHFE